ncbi:uncharacterized protein [Miscanthus floridulus]|uniref:uncharacterized protein isoform X1 n=1 Tax=Miscanthus floridulus TaxID=154761 RepID=UPI00345AD78C
MLGNQQQQLRRARTGGSLTPVDEEHNRDQHSSNPSNPSVDLPCCLLLPPLFCCRVAYSLPHLQAAGPGSTKMSSSSNENQQTYGGWDKNIESDLIGRQVQRPGT